MTSPEESNATTCPGTVAVIIPVYNGERFIRRALDSILRQTRPAKQIIVIDDGSTDTTKQTVQNEYGQRVTLISQAKGGISKARNAGLRVVDCEFVAFLDADDWWEPAKLEKQLDSFVRDPGAVANYTGLHMVDEISGDETDSPPADLGSQLRWCNPGVPPSSMMLRSSLLREMGAFKEELRACEDWDLWFRISKVGRFSISPEPLTDYRVSSGGLSGDADHMFRSFLQILDTPLLDGLKGRERGIWRRRIVSYQAFKSCLTARAAGDRAKERSYMWMSLRTWPSPFWAPERFKYFVVTLLKS